MILNYANLVTNHVYVLVASGALAAGFDAAGFTGRARVSPVSLPGALLLFGVSLGGIGIMGYRRRRLAHSL